MSSAEFDARLDELFDRLEEVIEDAADDADLDFDSDQSGGVLTLEFGNGTTMIFSRQPAMNQLWLAARGGAFHFSLDDSGDWICTRSGNSLDSILREQLAQQVELTLPADWQQA